MTFADIPQGAAVFVDANVLIYHFTGHSQFGQVCTDLFTRIEQGDIRGVTSSHMLSEIAHRLMTIEAAQTFGWPFAGIAYRLRRQPDQVQQLTQFQQAVDEVLASDIDVLPVTGQLISIAAAISRQTGLLSNDALLIAVMRQHGMAHLASNDADFDRVPGITRYMAG